MQTEIIGATVELDDSRVDESRADVRAQLREYRRGERRQFDLVVRFPGGGFTGDVMAAMCDVPYGETRTYGDLAASLGTSPIAVGGACGRNPVPIVVPCHRVVGADSIGGFSGGDGVALKRRLLAHEGVSVGDDGVLNAADSEQTTLPSRG